MMVQGDASDTVNLDHLLGKDGADTGTWSAKGSVTVEGASYAVYQHSGMDAELLIEQGVKVNLV